MRKPLIYSSDLILAILLAFAGNAQDITGGGSLLRDITGGAALIFRAPQNPTVHATGGGRLRARQPVRKVDRDHRQHDHEHRDRVDDRQVVRAGEVVQDPLRQRLDPRARGERGDDDLVEAQGEGEETPGQQGGPLEHVVAQCLAPEPADSTFGNAGAPAVVGWKLAAARRLVPSAVNACSYIA